MRKWFWLALFVLVAIAVVISGSGFFQQRPLSIDTIPGTYPKPVGSSNSDAAKIPQLPPKRGL